MDNVNIVVHKRDVTGTRASKRLRREGLIPGVIYGHGSDAVLIAVEPHALRDALATEAGLHAVLNVTFEGQKRGHKAIVKEMELDKVKNNVIHLDLQEIRLDETIESVVAVHFEGESKGVKAGGLLEEAVREVTVKGVVTAIPEHLVMDISDLDVNETLKVSDLQVPEGIEILHDAGRGAVLRASAARRRRGRGERPPRPRPRPSPSWSARRKKRPRPEPRAAGRLTARHRGALPPLTTRRAPRRRPGQSRAGVRGHAAQHRLPRDRGARAAPRRAPRQAGVRRPRGRRQHPRPLRAPAAAHHVHERLRPQRGRRAARPKLPLADVLVVHDHIDLPFGRLRLMEGGGSGGHNGLKSITGLIGPGYARLRVGVDRPPSTDPDVVADFVLSPFRREPRRGGRADGRRRRRRRAMAGRRA